MEGEKRVRGLKLESQLSQALLDAQELQKRPKKLREASYISEMKLASIRILTLQRMLSRRDNAALQSLKDENAKLKQDNAALKLEVETLKATQRPDEPVTPAKDATVERMIAESKKLKESAPEVKPVEPLPSKGSSFPEVAYPIRLTPPRVEDVVQLPDTLAQPRPVVTHEESERKAIAAMSFDSQFRNTEANVEGLIREAKQKAEANKSIVDTICGR